MQSGQHIDPSRSDFREFYHRIADALFLFLFFTDPATPEIYTLSLHDALPIYGLTGSNAKGLYFALMCGLSSTAIVVKLLYDKAELDTLPGRMTLGVLVVQDIFAIFVRSEEHTSELQSRENLVCRLLLEKKKKK